MAVDELIKQNWEIPKFKLEFWDGARAAFCLVIPVINEGERISLLLGRVNRLRLPESVDVIIVDGGSTDGSVCVRTLKQFHVRCLLTVPKSRGLGQQLRCAYSFALEQGYRGVITIDGNDKDDPCSVPKFIERLEAGADFVQGSRFIAGGYGVNTPKYREFAIRFLHAPMLSRFSTFTWTDTTQGFRGYSRRLLLDDRISLFRAKFVGYELLAYLTYICPRLGFRCEEIPTIRRYPKGEVPSKISTIGGSLKLLRVLLKACLGGYNPPKQVVHINSDS